MEIACDMSKSKWFLPGFAVLLGVAMFVALWIGGNPIGGVYSGAVIVLFGLFILIAGTRSETIRGLRGDGRDERFARIDIHATAFTGIVLVSVIIVAWMVEVARGHNGNPFGWMGAVGGLTYLAAIAFMRWRG
jgi:hypothetical protein